ncbi:alpha/beta hydrolase [Pseudoalteromonas tunicata]|jgi:acetyl esterase/lipase|uniref:Lipase, putative n=1 Tax=Pseudoalteromonas tunicata D2 TaxID=87626 RepID=A4C971_9GAMM|nr:alpha/beta hydrolase [Pseudoalteromonas tunicata]ATC93639.1 esterase / lipase [Pseudoalteromonas tunicata]AXT29472.1 alpha/beta hydrolase [Pseudoalteromonas tunicata]EAR29136.1 lipase, putative [Pseudoalteromonas tunicata D2]
MKKLSLAITTALSLMMTTSAFAASKAGSPGTEINTQAFLEVLAQDTGLPLHKRSHQDVRKVLEGAQQGAVLPAADVTKKTIKVNGESIDLVIVKPVNAKGDLPAFMYFHGGGWVLGDFPTHERLIRDLVVRSGAAAVYVDYALSPEVKYPTAINQGYAATKWVAENGKKIGIDGSRLAVAGNSAGGNMATVISIKAKEAGTPNIKFQLLLWPVTDSNPNYPSYNEYAQGHFLSSNVMEWMWNNYLETPQQRNEIYAAPLRASVEQLTSLPPALIQVAEKDILRDEAEAYGRKLNAAGVAVTVTRYNGMIHDFGLLNPLSNIPAVQDSLDQAGNALKKHLN